MWILLGRGLSERWKKNGLAQQANRRGYCRYDRNSKSQQRFFLLTWYFSLKMEVFEELLTLVILNYDS